MLSKNASLIYDILKNNEQGFIPVNIDIDGLSRIEVLDSVKELFDYNLVKLRDCHGTAIELNYSKVLYK